MSLSEYFPTPILAYMSAVTMRALTEPRVPKIQDVEEPEVKTRTRLKVAKYVPEAELKEVNHLYLATANKKQLLFSVQNPTSEQCLVRFQAPKDTVLDIIQRIMDSRTDPIGGIIKMVDWSHKEPQEIFIFANGAKMYYMDGGWWMIGGYRADGKDAIDAMFEVAKHA